MKLHDSSRPRILHRPAFITGWHVIPRLQIWPLENDLIELSMMLPIEDQRFAGKWYSTTVSSSMLHDIMKYFREDPEEFVLEYFDLAINNLRLVSSHSAPKAPQRQESDPQLQSVEDLFS